MDIDSYLEEKRKIIDKALDTYIPKETEYPQTLHKAMRHSLFAGGKRLRPILALAVAEMYNCPIEKVMPLACAIELIHTGSLIFDDLPPIDNASMRRHNPTCHKIYGDGIAMLACYALVARAPAVIADTPNVDKEILTKICKDISDAIGSMGMAGGQAVELENTDKENVDEKTLEFVHLNKTAKLFMVTMSSAALISGAPQKDVENIIRIAQDLGVAFQIKDDILDIEGEKEQVGKDILQDKNLSAVSILGIEKCKENKTKKFDSIKKRLENFNMLKSAPVLEIIRKLG